MIHHLLTQFFSLVAYYQSNGLQYGYGFIYFDDSPEGVQATLQASRAIANTSIGYVQYSGHIIYSDQSFTLLKDGKNIYFIFI